MQQKEILFQGGISAPSYRNESGDSACVTNVYNARQKDKLDISVTPRRLDGIQKVV